MAGKNDRMHGQRDIRAGTLSKERHDTIPKSKHAKRKLPDDKDKPKGHPAKRLKADHTHQPLAIHDPCQSGKGQRSKAMPQAHVDSDVHQPRPEISKRPRDPDMEETPQIQNKRAKVNENAGPDHRPTVNYENDSDETDDASARNSETASKAQRHSLPVEVQHLVQKYDFSTMSILSSSKIESRVRNLLDKIGKFSFATPGANPGVVVLSAKAEVAGKMGSIVEIAKQKIQEERGKWWQYNKLEGKLTELKPKQTRRAGDGGTLEEWGKEKGHNATTESKAVDKSEHASVEKQGIGGNINEDRDEDLDEGFETMVNPTLRDCGSTTLGSDSPKKVRQTARMTIFFARIPVPGLKELYG